MTGVQAKAWTYHSTEGGLTKNLRLTDYELPDLGKTHVLIETLNVSLNPGDYKLPDVPILGRFVQRPASPCFDFCGRVRALPREVHSNLHNLKVGQIVFGLHRDIKTLGTLKTIIYVRTDAVYSLPENVPVEHGSAFGVAALTAYQAIVPHAKANGKILINGGSGGVGTFCIQIAKALDMYTIATCSEAGAQLCKDLGADEILNYKSPTFSEDLRRTQVDLVIDNVGHDPSFHSQSMAFLKPNGQFVLVALMSYDWRGISSMLMSWLWPSWLGGTPRKWTFVFTDNGISSCEQIAKMARNGKIKVVIDSVFPFKDVPQAFERLESGRAKGKIIVNVISGDR